MYSTCNCCGHNVCVCVCVCSKCPLDNVSCVSVKAPVKAKLPLCALVEEQLLHAHTHSYHDWSPSLHHMSPSQPDIATVYLLAEVIGSLSSDPASWLPVLRHHSLITVLVRMMDEHLRLRTDPEFIEASLGFFLALSRTKPVSQKER